MGVEENGVTHEANHYLGLKCALGGRLEKLKENMLNRLVGEKVEG